MNEAIRIPTLIDLLRLYRLGAFSMAIAIPIVIMTEDPSSGVLVFGSLLIGSILMVEFAAIHFYARRKRLLALEDFKTRFAKDELKPIRVTIRAHTVAEKLGAFWIGRELVKAVDADGKKYALDWPPPKKGTIEADLYELHDGIPLNFRPKFAVIPQSR